MRRVPAGDTANHHILDHHRSAGDIAAAFPRILDIDAPDLFTGALVERYEMVVGGPEKDVAPAYGDSPVLFAV